MNQRDVELQKVETLRETLKILHQLVEELHYSSKGGEIIVRGFDGRKKTIEIPPLRDGSTHISDPKFFESGHWGYEGPGGAEKEIMSPGWYFWDEVWASPHGPYKTKEECIEALGEYCKTI